MFRWHPVFRIKATPRSILGCVLAGILSAVLPAPTLADPPQPSSGREVWTGADASANVWLTYAGVTVAPWSGIHDEGVRFRAAGGYGQYVYAYALPGGGQGQQFHTDTYFADVLVGYLKRWGELTAKGFVGASIVSHDIEPLDVETVVVGDEVGVKGVVELWLNVGRDGWSAVDLSWSSAHNTRAARARVGYRVWPNVSLGLEGGINLDAQGQCRVEATGTQGCKTAYDATVYPADMLDYARAGTFVRYEWDRGEVSLSVGALGGSFSGDGSTEISPYVTLNWLTQF